MDLQYLLEKQRQLDDYIIKSKGLEDFDRTARLNNTILALFVEVGEMANEIRSFKHWKLDAKPSHHDIVIGEMVDCLHFMLSLANQLGFTADDIEMAYEKKNRINFERQDANY